jgi:hypothetical protein
LPLLILVRCAPPLWAAVGGGFWGLSVWFFAAFLASSNVPSVADACLRFAGIGVGFGLLGAAATRRFGFHPFLLSAAWLLLELALHPVPSISMDSSELSYFLGRVVGAACLGAIPVFCNALLLWLWETVARPSPNRIVPRGVRPDDADGRSSCHVPAAKWAAWANCRAPPLLLHASFG